MGEERPSRQCPFKRVNTTKEAEAAYDLRANRVGIIQKPIGTIATIAHLTKAALGAGILGAPGSYASAGWICGLALNLIIGFYLYYCLKTLGECSKVVCKRVARPVLTYAQLGEAACCLFPGNRIPTWGRCFRFYIDFLIMLELFGACVAYQLLVARTIKQLVENSPPTTPDAPYREGGLHMRSYVLIMIIPFVLICLIRHLKILAPFSIMANFAIALAVLTNIYYAFTLNPKFENMQPVTNVAGFFKTCGLLTFSMSCACQILTVENSMRDPNDYRHAVLGGYILIVILVMSCSFFGYVAFTSDIQTPVTINYPMNMPMKILKGVIAFMIYVTHAINFFVPFKSAWFYIGQTVKKRVLFWELFYRALFVILIGLLAYVFPAVAAIMSFLGCFCLANMGFVFPMVIDILIHYETGYGPLRWRLLLDITLFLIGFCIWVVGSYYSGLNLIKVFAAASK